MKLYLWAAKWGIPVAAVIDLQNEMNGVVTDLIPAPAEHSGSETDVQNTIRIEATKKGLRLWRNNVGAVHTEDGRFIRYGLCNDSKKMNELIKSSDLIGIRPRLIFPADVGKTIGQFVAREVKKTSWQYSGTKREEAQLRFIEMINANGGDASFANGSGTL